MELRHLRYFCAVAEEEHVTRAAQVLNLAQPALTQQIKALEAEIGVALLRRVGRGVELTEAGRAFWHEARAILDRTKAATLTAQEIHRGHAGRLLIGLAETASFAEPVTAILKLARERWPSVEFNLSQARTVDLLASLGDRKIDLAVVRSPMPSDTGLAAVPFLTEGFVVAAPRGHPLAEAPEIQLAELGGVPLIITSGRPYDINLRTGFIGALSDIGKTPNIVQATPEYVTAINLVAAGFGVTVVPSVLTGLRHESVVYRPLISDPPLRTQLIVASRRTDVSPVARNFLALVQSNARA